MKLTSTQYAAMHGRTEREIRRLIKDGRIPFEIDSTNPMKPQYRIDENTPYPVKKRNTKEPGK